MQSPGSFPHYGTVTHSYEGSANGRWRSLIVRARAGRSTISPGLRPTVPPTPLRRADLTALTTTIASRVKSVQNSPQIFVSYAKEDVRYADELRRLLKLADFDPWIDSAGLLGGDAWEARLREVIRTSDFVVALLSGHTTGGYQEKELRVAMDNAPAGRKADVPFVLPCALMRLLRGDAEQVSAS